MYIHPHTFAQVYKRQYTFGDTFDVPYSKKVWQGKFGEFGKSSMICQTKTIQISVYN